MSALYHTNYLEWLDSQIDHLKKNDFHKLDLKNLIEEMEDMGGFKSSIESYLLVALTHKLKMKYAFDDQCKRIWQVSIDNAKDPIICILEDHPSLKIYPSLIFEKTYKRARRNAAKQTGYNIDIFPEECPWTIDQILGE